jgi:hypothetical protein
MDQKFSGLLQTELRSLGLVKGTPFAPPKSQDPFDRLLHEYFVASVMSSIGENRKKIAKEMIEQEREGEIAALAAEAIKQMAMQTSAIIQTEHYIATMKCAKPVEAVDNTAFQNELIKLGVDQVTIAKALNAAQKTRAPAKTLTVTTTHSRG